MSFFIKRKVNPFNSLGLAGFISLIINPLSIFEVGFQLSFLSVFAIIFGFKVFSLKFFNNFILRYAEYIFFSSLFVMLFITPVVSYYFGRVYILSIFYNIILIPFFTAILIINFVFIITSPLKLIAQSIGVILSFLIPIFNYLIHFLGKIKISSISLSFSPKAMIIYYFLLGLFFIFLAIIGLRIKQVKNQ